jgi:hypothetical protein
MALELQDEIIKIVIDKGIFALLLVIAGFWINKKLEIFKNEQARLTKLDEQTRALKNELQKQREILVPLTKSWIGMSAQFVLCTT